MLNEGIRLLHIILYGQIGRMLQSAQRSDLRLRMWLQKNINADNR